MKPFLRILLPAAVCGLLLGACTQRQTTLKFMSYNIRNGRGIDNVQDLGRVAEIINRTAPDLVALQELDSVTGRMADHPLFGKPVAVATVRDGLRVAHVAVPLFPSDDDEH